jgi:hypothetical protein
MRQDEIAAISAAKPDPRAGAQTSARWVLGLSAGLLLLLALPVVVHGAPLADDYLFCLRPVNEGGYGSYLAEMWRDTGVVRPARFLELLLISKACGSVPFGFVILVPLALKFTVAALLLGLLRDMRLRSPWPEIGTAMWLLEPLGTEAALWPSALHVPLGLALALLALRLYRRDRLVWAAVATLGACLSIEHVIFAIPFAVWLTSPTEVRRRGTTVAFAVAVAVLISYAIWPGSNPRQAVTLADRLHNALSKGEWYLFFPAVGLGLHSGLLGFIWALPYSVAAVAVGTIGGAVAFPRLLSGRPPGPSGAKRATWSVVKVVALVLLVNLPLIVTEVGYSARTFTPTWLVLSAAAAAGGAHVAWRRTSLLGAVAGAAAAFAVLSLALSVFVRVRTAEFNEAAARWIAERVPDGAVVAVCDVQRTVVEPAPLGAFHLHEFHTEWPTWIQYHADRIVEIRRSGLRYWGSRCPDLEGADLVIRFPRLVRELTDA